jgi:hypothetical protein
MWTLGSLPSVSKLHFFMSKSTYLGIAMALDALKECRLEDALVAAADCR